MTIKRFICFIYRGNRSLDDFLCAFVMKMGGDTLFYTPLHYFFFTWLHRNQIVAKNINDNRSNKLEHFAPVLLLLLAAFFLFINRAK